MPAESPFQKADTAFRRKLARAVKALKREAAGRQCGTCRFARFDGSGFGFCSHHLNLEGADLHIYRVDATACRNHTESS